MPQPATRRPYTKRATMETSELAENAKDNSKLKANIKDKKYYTLNLSAEFQNLQIENARDKIASLKQNQQSIYDEFCQKKGFYEEAKKEFDAISELYEGYNEQIQKQHQLIEITQNFKNSPAAVKHLRVVGTGTKQNRPADYNLNWLEASRKVLLQHNRFMTLEELFSEFHKDKQMVEAGNKTKSKFKGLVYPAKASVWSAAIRPETPKGKGTGRIKILTVYNDKIGLIEWVDDNGIPTDPKHMKDFVHG